MYLRIFAYAYFGLGAQYGSVNEVKSFGAVTGN